MTIFEKLGGIAIIAGSALLCLYSVLFPTLLPLDKIATDYTAIMLSPGWRPLAIIALAGILLLLAGFYGVYAKMRPAAGLLGAIGFLFVEAAYLLQACKVTWELFLYPIIAKHSESAFLLREAIIKNDPAVITFRIAASVTILMGIVLFCLVLYLSKIYPKSAALLIFAGALIYAIGPMISVWVSIAGIFTFAVGCLLIGLCLLRPTD